MEDDVTQPKLLIFSSLFPTKHFPLSGIFIKERMFRVGKQLPIVVVSPKPWFPFQFLIRFFKKEYRPPSAAFELVDGVNVFRPRFVSIPGYFRSFDGFSMALASFFLVRRLCRKQGFNAIDAHFAYPDGYAAVQLGKWLGIPVTITLRGTEVSQSKTSLKKKLLYAVKNANKVFAVADFLKKAVNSAGADRHDILVVGNGVDTHKFYPLEKQDARMQLGIEEGRSVIITVGGLVERKGFHRVLEVLPELITRQPHLLYLIVGGASAEGDWSAYLRRIVAEHKLDHHVRFLGSVDPDRLRLPLSASDVFVLPTRNEGWANVLLEAMACGLPVVTTNIGGNAEVITSDELGILVEFGDSKALLNAIIAALKKNWNTPLILEYAKANNWDTRIVELTKQFKELVR